jgi:GGDEF domain-containing protein
VTLSIGIAVFDPAQASQQTITLPRMLLAHADAAMYQAKRNGKNGYVIQLVT